MVVTWTVRVAGCPVHQYGHTRSHQRIYDRCISGNIYAFHQWFRTHRNGFTTTELIMFTIGCGHEIKRGHPSFGGTGNGCDLHDYVYKLQVKESPVLTGRWINQRDDRGPNPQ